MSFEEKYRRKVPESQPASPAAMELLKAAAEEYKAYFALSQPQFDLWIRPNAANPSPPISIPYSRRCLLTEDGNGFVIILQFDSGPVLSVRLHGRNMQELLMKLLTHEAVYVREYDARFWPEVAEGEACITGIDVQYRVAGPKDDAPEKPEPPSMAKH